MIQATQRKALVLVINQALKLDPAARQRLQKLSGKRLRIECVEPPVDLIIAIDADSIALLPVDEQAVDSHLRGTLSAFVKLISSEDRAAGIINSDVQLRGSSQLLIELQAIFEQLDLDWEYQLAQMLGDLPAHLIGKLHRESRHWLKQGQPLFMRHLQEFILEEARLSPRLAELESFIAEVQSLRQRSERLEARIQRLHNKPTT